MRVQQLGWSNTTGWCGDAADCGAELVPYFGSRDVLACGTRYFELREMFPKAHILGCSTGGQIRNNDVTEDEIAAAALHFAATNLRLVSVSVETSGSSRACGQVIGRGLKAGATDLAGIFVLSDGLNVNGSELAAGIVSVVGPDVPVTGGLAGDGARFQETLVGADCAPRNHTVAAVGFYGNAIRIGHGSAGGWDEFGPRRQITRSQGNVLFELDDEPALDLYERYLGEEDIKGLPGTTLLFPLRIRNPHRPEHDIVRTVLAVDRDARSMTFAGDMPQGWAAQFMRGNFDRLAAGAAAAAQRARIKLDDNEHSAKIAILVSCLGRKPLMGQHIVDELEAAGTEFGTNVPRIEFYSYDEISPHCSSGVCELHNQTMTVTAITEQIDKAP
jgi:hypothetical protein